MKDTVNSTEIFQSRRTWYYKQQHTLNTFNTHTKNATCRRQFNLFVMVEFAKGEKCIKIQYFELRFCRDIVLGATNNNITYL